LEVAGESRTLEEGEKAEQGAVSKSDNPTNLADMGRSGAAPLQRTENRVSHWSSHGDVLVRSQVVGFKKIKFFTNENIGAGKLELPENEMHTTSYWLTLERALVESLPFSISERQSGMFGLLHAMESVATLLLMCDGRDLGTAIGERPPRPGAEDEEFAPVSMEDAMQRTAKEFFEPNLYLFDAYPGGIGFSEPLYRAHELLVSQTRELILGCGCEFGCPSCVGPAGDLAPCAKKAALAILNRICGEGTCR
jgi:DEAD/DEAH box helicase domain-containing protein